MTPHEKKLIHNFQFRIDTATERIDALQQIVEGQKDMIVEQQAAIALYEKLIATLQDELRIVREMQIMPTLN